MSCGYTTQGLFECKTKNTFQNLGTEVRSYSTLGSNIGRGLFATKHFAPGEIVEKAPMIVFRDDDDRQKSVLDDHLIYIDDDHSGIGLGYFTMTNHSDHNYNTELEQNKDFVEVKLTATRWIKPGDEILTHYGDNYWENKNINKI